MHFDWFVMPSKTITDYFRLLQAPLHNQRRFTTALFVLAMYSPTGYGEPVKWRIQTCATQDCNVGCKFLPALAWFTPAVEQGAIIRHHVIEGKEGQSQYQGCTITDAANWACQESSQSGRMQPVHRMVKGIPSVIGGTASQQSGTYICYQPA